MSYPDTNELIVRHLYWIKVEQDGKTIESCLTKAFYQARTITGRDDKNGQPLEDIESRKKLGWWSGAMVYIAILDQIGTIYKLTGNPKIEANENSIKYALKNFGPFVKNDKEDKAKINAIIGLRNSFMHDFSLINIAENKKREINMGHYNFVLNQLDEGEIVTTIEENSWDGTIKNLNSQNKTIINLKRLGDMVEDIFEELKTLRSLGNLVTNISDEEFSVRYFLQY